MKHNFSTTLNEYCVHENEIPQLATVTDST
jgi:hypothetical protein